MSTVVNNVADYLAETKDTFTSASEKTQTRAGV